ncbi:peptide ABC transporter substrate-binding protein [Atopobacter sp. AH10]|uniref:peptide ABC transporter substrate-binding protein n=1 Tax=Atopobacter sp. AH10 TaxID=2315861 RepID=UPI001314B03C|nr:peptide ABC transporter substrate-binding protein [Atopobacter sp. AH10]
MTKKLPIRLASVVALGLLTISGAQELVLKPILHPQSIEAKEKEEKIVVKAIETAEVTAFDSVKCYDVISQDALSKIGEGLVKFNDEGKIVPAGAIELPKVSEDGLTYSFKLRPEAKFSNGEKITAKDYVYAFRRLADPKTASANARKATFLKNGEAIVDGKAKPETLGVEAISDDELKVTVEKALPNVLNLLAGTNFFPQSQSFVEKAGEGYGTSSDKILSNGPFVVKGWDSTSMNYSYEKNPNYYDTKKVQVDEVQVAIVKDPNTIVNLYESGEADIAPISGSLLNQYRGKKELKSFPGSSHSYLELGIGYAKALNNENLRQALSYAIDRKTIAEKILSGNATPVKGLVAPNSVFDPKSGKDFTEDSKDFGKYDLKKAKAYWAKAKKELGVDKVEFDLLVTDAEGPKKIGEYIQGQVNNNLKGIKINLLPLPAKARFKKLLAHQFDLALGGWQGDSGDALEYIANFRTGVTHNHGQYVDKAFDEQLDKIEGELSQPGKEVEREKALHEAENYLAEHKAFIPTIQNNSSYLVDKKIKKIATIPGKAIDYTTLRVEEKK